MENTIIEIEASCAHCNLTYKFPVYQSDMEKYLTGKYNIQDCFPYISPEYRELMISNVCNKCWIEIFGNYEEE